MKMIMFHINFMLFSILSWISAIECMEVIPERASLTYLNPKYFYLNGTLNVRRYSRRSRYYVNLMVTTKQTFGNNITINVGVSQLLHNEYRRSFVELSYKLCDLILKEPFVGGTLRNSGLVECPVRPGYISITNMSAPTEHFPSVFPFEKGRVEVALSVTKTKEPVLQLFVVASFKQKP